MGQSLSRLADWQTDMLADALTRDAGRTADGGVRPTRRSTAARALLPRMREVQDYVWRRHLAANADRLLAARRARATAGSWRSASPTWSGTPPAAAGMGGRELGAMVEDFESIAAEVIARHHGRVVKTVGRRRAVHRAAAPWTPSRSGWSCPEAWDADGAAAAAGGRRLRRGAHPARRRLLAGGEPGQPADLDRPARRPCWSTASWPSGCAGDPGLPGAAAAPGVGARLRPPAAVAGPAPRRTGDDGPARYDEDALRRDRRRRRCEPADDGYRRDVPAAESPSASEARSTA